MMREQKRFGERSAASCSREVNVKYIILTEGTETEPRYFEAVNEHKADSGISSLVRILPLMRSYGEDTWSNPQKILDRMLLNIDESQGASLSYGTLLNAMIECLYYSDFLKKRESLIKEISALLDKFYKNELKKSSGDLVENKEDAIRLAIAFFKKERPRICELILSHINDSLDEQMIPYDPKIDKLCLVADRDAGSFTPGQYDYVLRTCREKNVQLYVSNPCFEFWLLLHTDKVFDLDKNRLLKNELVTASKRFVDKELDDILGCGYKKNFYNAQFFIERTDTAIKNEMSFCEDAAKLKDEAGSNIGLLITRMRQEKGVGF
ncbi:MAG: RloB family protein [Fibrobacteraceae bacterium]|nr:RloB family protein [Fibrobacteraceae bacterium]